MAKKPKAPSIGGGGGGAMPMMPGTSLGGGGGGGSKPGAKGYDFTFGPLAPLTKETDTTYGGTKPGKAPTQKAPKAPDPFELIKAQGVENRVNESGPSGTTSYTRDPVTGVWTANRSFSPELQGIYNKQVGMMGTDPNAYNTDVANAMFARQKSLLDPVFAEQGRSLEQKLANQGLPMGSEAYTGEMNRFDKAKSDAYTNAANQATLSGTQTGMAQRQNEFNQMAALLGGQQVGPTAPIDVTGPFNSQYQGQLNSVNMANQNAAQRNGQMTSGAAAAAGMMAAMMMCSKDLKEDCRPIDEREVLKGVEALPVERWVYKADGAEHIGPYAEDFKAIFGLGDGQQIAVVDAVGVCLAAIKALTKRVQELEAA